MSMMTGRRLMLVVVVVGVLSLIAGTALAQKRYVGSKACQECHEDEYNNFTKYAKKAHSYEHIIKMRKDVTKGEFDGCLKCHTTGYGKPGGFKSINETPGLKEAGCEVCHGPGSKHCDSEDSADIKGKLKFQDCEGCHTPSIVKEFNFKPFIHGGAH